MKFNKLETYKDHSKSLQPDHKSEDFKNYIHLSLFFSINTSNMNGLYTKVAVNSVAISSSSE